MYSSKHPLALSEAFLSIQGESTHAGRPCVFIRLAGCNLRCRWCDTRYSYTPAFHRTPEEIVDMVREWAPVRLVQVTGGEPLLQESAIDLLRLLLQDGCEVLLETNGSLHICDTPRGVRRIVDVKCPSSGEEDSFLDANLRCLTPDDQLKFVLTDRVDFDFARRFLPRIPQGVEALFSPVFGSLKPKTLAEWIVEERLPVRMQLQLHKFIWEPDARGV